MSISIIAALSGNRGIGRDNRLLYWLPNDLKRFKVLTTGHTIVMGRKTYESLPKGALPHRRNIVLSRREGAAFPGTEVFASPEEALAHCGADEEVFVIGGAGVYRQMMPLADRLFLTWVADDSRPADVFFPEVDEKVWKETACEEYPADEKHEFAYRFVDYERR